MRERLFKIQWSIPVVLVCLLNYPIQAKYGGGNGDPNDPYLIHTADHMNTIGIEPNDWDKHFKLVQNIDLNEYTETTFNLIGTSEKPFTGVFNGAQHRISRFNYISNGETVGLFSYVSGEQAEIRDLILVEPMVYNLGYTGSTGTLVGSLGKGATIRGCCVMNSRASGKLHVGGMVGNCSNGTILSCYASCSVLGDGIVGGLVGRVFAGFVNGCASHCYVMADSRAGGLIGVLTDAYSWIISESESLCVNCYAAGVVIGGENGVGGLVGSIGPLGHVDMCFSSCSVTGMGRTVGGLVGVGYGKPKQISRSFWNSSLTQESGAGGIPLQIDQMNDYDIYHAAGWDFFGESVNGTDDVWRLCPDSQYPRLVWEFPQADIACPLGVDFQDYATLAMCWQEPNAVLSDVCRYSDIDESCAVNIHDLVVLTQNWLEPILPPAPIQAVLSKTNLSEADNESTIVTLSRIRETNLPLLITIVNQDPYEVHAPMYAIIPADQESTQIRVEAVNNGKVDGRQQATLVFMVEGYLDTEVVLEIEDDDREERKTLGGHLCGNLVRGDYIVTTDITVDSGQTLELLPGSILRFTSGTGLSIRGCLRAIGNSEGSIILTSESVVPQQGDWKGIIIEGKSPVIDMKHVEIANAVTGIKFILDWYAKVNLSLCNSSIHHCSNTGLYIDSRPGMNISSDDVRVFNNKIYENTDFGIVLKASSDWIVQGAFCKGPYSSTNDSYIRKNEMYQNDVGIYMTNPNIGGRCPGASGGSIGSQITGNCISYNRVAVLSDDRPHGIISATLSNNLILKNTDSGLVFHGKLSVMIANNTIVGNGGSGIRHDSYYDVVLNLVNNIITENDTGIMSLNNEESNTADIRIVGYNNVYHNTEFDWTGYPPEYGNLSTMNINGTPADIHMNVSIDPIFAGSNDFHLTSNSPMVGAGTFIEGITPEDDVDGDMRTESIDIGFDEFQ